AIEAATRGQRQLRTTRQEERVADTTESLRARRNRAWLAIAFENLNATTAECRHERVLGHEYRRITREVDRNGVRRQRFRSPVTQLVQFIFFFANGPPDERTAAERHARTAASSRACPRERAWSAPEIHETREPADCRTDYRIHVPLWRTVSFHHALAR